MTYDAAYYQSGNYEFYAERRDRYLRTAQELSELLERLGLVSYSDVLLDYGCGPGYLLEGFSRLGFVAVGVDASEWARARATEGGLSVQAEPAGADIMTALDVFEHMEDAAIIEAIRAVNPRVIVARIPCSTDGGKTFHLAVSRRDASHINCRTKEAWEAFFADLGYLTMRLCLFTVYDTPGVACLLAVRK